MICENCGNNTFSEHVVSETFTVSGKLVLVEDIPAQVCDRCGAPNFSADVAERVRKLVRGPHQPIA